jgi:hypothetical protein
MSNSEERTTVDGPPEERDEEEVERTNTRRGAPIDEDVAGQINAALPDEDPDEDRESV